MKSLIKIGCFYILALSTSAQNNYQKQLQIEMINVLDGGVIEVEAGKFNFLKSISLEGKKRIVIRGKGIDKTILSFKEQTEGAEGIRISNCEQITVENLTIQDAKGDCIKAHHVKGIIFRNMKVEWTGKPKAQNGAYGFYPVECDSVLIEKNIAIGASEAGFYVGQSKNIILKNNKSYHNVVGYEIENSINVSVFQNEATANAAGLVVLDLPRLVLKKGTNTKIYDNDLHDNNYENFSNLGNIVDKIPSGTGFLILAASNIEFYNNRVSNNKTLSCGIMSFKSTGLITHDKEYDAYPKAIYIHKNTFVRKPRKPSYEGLVSEVSKHQLKFGGKLPHIIFDGVLNPKTLDNDGKLKPEFKICIKNNVNETFANLDLANDYRNISTDLSDYLCE